MDKITYCIAAVITVSIVFYFIYAFCTMDINWVLMDGSDGVFYRATYVALALSLSAVIIAVIMEKT